MTETAPNSTVICADDCHAGACRHYCGFAAVDELLSTPGAASGEEVDLLLDLRFQLSSRGDAEAALRLFCDLRRRLEQRHYLVFYRLRRWLENNLVATVRSCQAAEPARVRVKLDHYCVEAIRRVALCAGLRAGSVLLAPRVQFGFVRLAAQSSAAGASSVLAGQA